MQWLKKNIAVCVSTLTLLGGGGTWAANFLIEQGYLKAKVELNEEYNEVIIEAITYRSKYELCSTELRGYEDLH